MKTAIAVYLSLAMLLAFMQLAYSVKMDLFRVRFSMKLYEESDVKGNVKGKVSSAKANTKK